MRLFVASVASFSPKKPKLCATQHCHGYDCCCRFLWCERNMFDLIRSLLEMKWNVIKFFSGRISHNKWEGTKNEYSGKLRFTLSDEIYSGYSLRFIPIVELFMCVHFCTCHFFDVLFRSVCVCIRCCCCFLERVSVCVSVFLAFFSSIFQIKTHKAILWIRTNDRVSRRFFLNLVIAFRNLFFRCTFYFRQNICPFNTQAQTQTRPHDK